MSGDAAEPIAKEISRRGLSAPALLLLEAHRPLRPLLGVAAAFLVPIARPVLGAAVRHVEQVLGNEPDYEALVDRLSAEVEG